MRTIKGMYVPLMRFGQYFFSGSGTIATPPGATLAAKDKRGTAFTFENPDRKTNERAVKAYRGSTKDDRARSVVSEWIDPRTGRRPEVRQLRRPGRPASSSSPSSSGASPCKTK